VGGAQHEFVAHPIEGALLGDIAQHHQRTHAAAIGVVDRGQTPGQQPDLVVDPDLQVFGRRIQGAAGQHPLHAGLDFGSFQGGDQGFAQVILVPAQLAAGHWIGVFDVALGIEDHQAVVDAVEHCLQAPLAGHQGLDIGLAEAVQSLGHVAEAAAEQGEFGDLRSGQLDVEVALADALGSLGQTVDGAGEASGDAVGGHHPGDQDGHTDQRQQQGDDHRPVMGLVLHALQGHHIAFLQVVDAIAQGVEGLLEIRIGAQLVVAAGRRAQIVGEALVAALDVFQHRQLLGLVHLALDQVQVLFEALLGGDQDLGIRGAIEHLEQAVAQLLAHVQRQVDEVQIAAGLDALLAGQVQDADQADQQPDEGHGDQGGDAEKEAGVQLDRQFHSPYCLRFR